MKPGSLSEWLTLLESRHPTEIDLGLDRVAKVFHALGDIRPARTVITIGGTNGKGSCVALLESLALANGATAAAYTSPHLIRFNERVRINGEPVSDAQLCAAFERVECARSNVSLTYFEFTTLAAFVVMADAGVDIALLEVGLGGRLDAVNILDADIAIITSIDLDHQDWLGDTREAVATEKLGIARKDRWLLCGEVDLPQNFEREAARHGAKVLYRERDFYLESGTRTGDQEIVGKFVITSGTECFSETLANLKSPLLPLPSAACAVQAAQLLNWPLSEHQIATVLASTGLSGRYQELRYQGCKVILDVAHNPAAAKMLADKLGDKGESGLTAIIAMMKDKDIAGALAPVAPFVQHWMPVGLPNMPRAAQPTELVRLLYNVIEEPEADSQVTVMATVKEALSDLFSGEDNKSTLLIFGSFFTVSAALEWFQQQGVEL